MANLIPRPCYHLPEESALIIDVILICLVEKVGAHSLFLFLTRTKLSLSFFWKGWSVTPVIMQPSSFFQLRQRARRDQKESSLILMFLSSLNAFSSLIDYPIFSWHWKQTIQFILLLQSSNLCTFFCKKIANWYAFRLCQYLDLSRQVNMLEPGNDVF